jgi:valyl-tRNA synthetase
MPPNVPDKPGLEGLEIKWSDRWEADRIYRFDRTQPRERVYSIDTPPPTVSGSLHVGHVFSFTHTDTLARFKRMKGLEVFYPMGWDDNGLPTERRVQNYFGVRCDPGASYVSDFKPPDAPGKEPISISRPNFVELCLKLTAEDEKAFEALWRHLGLSVDWSLTYATIGKKAQKASQRGFLRLLRRGLAYQAEAPTLWDVDFRTAVAQAELEDRETPGAYHRIDFQQADGSGAVAIETTRPELLPACVALVAHPDDVRYQPLFGKSVRVPLFGQEVPVRAHTRADPIKGSGIAMVCTFGDVTDVTWWRELKLPMRTILGRDGRLVPATPADVRPEVYAQVAGLTAKQARARIVDLLRASGDMKGEPRPIVHPVKFYEKGDRPLEIVTSRQWFIKTLELKDELLRRGTELQWHPPFMRTRYESWVEGLNTDWLISRQRFFGVPFPVWYRLDEKAHPIYADPVVPPEDRLPVDPSTDIAQGFTESQRNQPGGFGADPDVMDTWATSSLTPQIAAGWEEDPDLFARVFPMDLRPQAHEIIRTWLFSSVVRSHFEHGSLPWSNAAISGWVLDPDRKKMSKSKGNVVTPMHLLEQYGSDGVRYWAARGRPGTDTAFEEGQMKIGRRLTIKLLNASKFVLARLGPEGEITEPLDRSMLLELAELVDAATTAFESYDWARALERTESFFWSFCDDYVELVKSRAYGAAGETGAASANRALTLALSTLLRLFAPFFPFTTEEVWSWWQSGSIHRAKWPESTELKAAAGSGDPLVLRDLAEVLASVRKAKTDAKLSMRAPVETVRVRAAPERLARLRAGERDLRDAGGIAQLVFEEGAQFAVEVVLAKTQATAP